MSETKSGLYVTTGRSFAPNPVFVFIVTGGITACLSLQFIFLIPTIDPAGVNKKSKVHCPTWPVSPEVYPIPGFCGIKLVTIPTACVPIPETPLVVKL